MKALVIDIETTATQPWAGTLLCLAAVEIGSEGRKGVWELHDIPNWVWQAIEDDTPLVSHSTFDPRFLKLMKTWGPVNGPFVDTKVAAHLLNENQPLDLESLYAYYCRKPMDKRLTREDGRVLFTTDSGKRLPMDEAPIDEVKKYCMRDAEATAELMLRLQGIMHDTGWDKDFWAEHVPFTQVLVDMECKGFPINLSMVEKVRPVIQAEADTLKLQLYDMLGYEVNLQSPKQLSEVLFSKVWYSQESIQHGLDLRKPTLTATIAESDDKPKAHVTDREVERHKDILVEGATPPGFVVQTVTHKQLHGYYTRKGLGLKKTPKSEKSGLPSTGTPALMVAHADDEFVRLLIEWRRRNKLLSTYLDVYPKVAHNGRIYANFNGTGTVTGRLSSSSPNLQNQPSRGVLGGLMRSLFQGQFVIGDHAQLEPRLAAHFSQDPAMLEVFRTGGDIYLDMAKRIFGSHVEKEDRERSICKTLQLALNYGAGAKKIADNLCLNGYPTTPSEAEGYLKELKAVYDTFFYWREFVIKEACNMGYVKTLGGRYRRLKGELRASGHKARFRGERQAVNAVIQGSAADVLRQGMLNHVQWLAHLPLLAQVHDEVIAEGTATDHELRTMQGCYENPSYELSVPLVFLPHNCSSWAEKDGVSIDLAEWEEGHVAA